MSDTVSECGGECGASYLLIEGSWGTEDVGDVWEVRGGGVEFVGSLEGEGVDYLAGLGSELLMLGF